MQALDCSILCVQEAKLPRSQLTSCAIDWSFLSQSPPTHDAFFSFCRKAPSQQAQRIGYSGVATFSDIAIPAAASQDGLTSATPDLHESRPTSSISHLAPPHDTVPLASLDAEGRSIITDLGAFVLINVYCPNDPGDDPQRLAYKLAFHHLVTATIAQLRTSRPPREIMLVGDLNVTHQPIDHCDPCVSDEQFASRPARRWLTHLLATYQLVDVYRTLHPKTPGFTCWNTVINARRSDYGTRIDYVLVSPGLAELVVGADRMPHVYGSDHCPVYVDLKCEGMLAEWAADGGHARVVGSPPIGSARRLVEFKGKQGTLAEWAKRGGIEQASGTSTSRPSSRAAAPEMRPSLGKTIKTIAMKKRTGQQPKLSEFFGKPVRAAAMEPMPVQESAQHELDQLTAISEPDIESTSSSSASSQVAAKSAWSAIFAPAPIPMCHHNELCTSFVVNKSGPTQGRKFWVCARPVGPSESGKDGKKQKVGEWRCGFFLWDKQRSRANASEKGHVGGPK
ncbi:Endonuclease/exonuclease/phosphatase [Catenaria anguillulae PL171]|uniref:DNA-(apurinic or apyrimidinic site) endonuclease n=1 Tax=Catenaria anguillulae PL171 TaxID=765915 RepID=A0A1Y2HP55_9FUNG|nr:Endonuclease/exonuclease/phosphatase [Catenaria anguillulae PL171]